MIRTIRIQGFKSISDQTLGLGRVNCFIGANGVGKSNILEAVGILGAAANGRVDDESIARRGVRQGLPRLYKISFEAGRIPPHIAIEATADSGACFRVSLLNPLEKPEPAWSFPRSARKRGALVERSPPCLVPRPAHDSETHPTRRQGRGVYGPRRPAIALGPVPCHRPAQRHPQGAA